MSLPNLPIVAQVNWSDSNAGSPWDQANANLLTTGLGTTSVLRSVDIQRNLLMPTVEQDTAVIVAEDVPLDVIPGYTGGPLGATVVLDPPRRVRILAQNPSTPGDWYMRHFGYASAIEPDPTAFPRYLVKVTVEGVLRYLAPRTVTPWPIPTGAVVYDPNDSGHSALTQLLVAARIWVPGLLDIEAPRGAPVPLPPPNTPGSSSSSTTGGSIPPANTGTVATPAAQWGGSPVQFGQALGELAYLAGAYVTIVPQYATSVAQPDWLLRWRVPLPGAAAAWSLNATNDDLTMTPRVQWGGELP